MSEKTNEKESRIKVEKLEANQENPENLTKKEAERIQGGLKSQLGTLTSVGSATEQSQAETQSQLGTLNSVGSLKEQ